MATTSSGGIGFAGLLAVLFIGLKLTGYIAWSWVWVLSPLWIGLAFVMAAIIGLLLIMAVFALTGAIAARLLK